MNLLHHHLDDEGCFLYSPFSFFFFFVSMGFTFSFWDCLFHFVFFFYVFVGFVVFFLFVFKLFKSLSYLGMNLIRVKGARFLVFLSGLVRLFFFSLLISPPTGYLI